MKRKRSTINAPSMGTLRNARLARLARLMVVPAVLGFSASAAQAVLSYSVAGSTLSQDFDTLVTTGTNVAWTNDTTLPGWSLFKQPSPGTALTTINANNGNSNTGTFYSYGSTASTERALGSAGSGGAYYGSPGNGAIAGWMAVAIQNNTGSTIADVNVLYDGEQWRNGGNASAQTMVLEYGFGASFTAVPTWTAAGTAFNFTSPTVGAAIATLDGNAASNRTADIGDTIDSVNWNNGDTLWFRWLEVNDVGNDHGMAIDNFRFSSASITPPPQPPVGADVLPAPTQTLVYDFSSFTGAGFTPTPAAGQLDSDNFIVTGLSDGALGYGSTQTTGDFARGASTGNVGTGGVYAFDHGGGDIGLGVQPGGTDFTPGTIELRLQNTTGFAIDLLSVEFETWVLNNEPRGNLFAFSYSTDGVLFTDVPSASLVSPDAAGGDWTLSTFLVNLTGLGLADDAFLYLRWTGDDVDGGPTGARDEFALDNIRITNLTPQVVAAVPEPATFGLLGVAGLTLVRRRRHA